MRIAAFGDIHGNIFALQAVLKALRAQSPDGMVVFGDAAYKFPWGAEVIDLLRALPHQAVLGNSELYLALWDTPLWPSELWNSPLAQAVVQWERERLGRQRLAYLASLPECAAFSGQRLEDLLVVHGVPGNPFVPFLEAPGRARPPWVQSEQRAAALLDGADADVIICGHTHAPLRRRVRPQHALVGEGTLIVNPGGVAHGRGTHGAPGRTYYALLDTTAAGWQVTSCCAEYDVEPLYAALLRLQGDYPLAEHLAEELHPTGSDVLHRTHAHFRHYRWGDTPPWWPQRDELPEWQALRGHEVTGT
jgi:predicted phosphodiesterase